ncbi:MAG: NUDIX domain-containing protein [Defluviitaleaceae bacterium]|nr:NUDIX domain-containing protein [Defluviitaleaceae bacterium]
MIRNHFTATGIVFNREKSILMIHHKKLRVWLPPGGHVEENELPDEAVLREIFEETGVRAKIVAGKQGIALSDAHCRELERPFTVLLEDIDKDGTHNHIDLVYICEAETDELAPQESEVNGIGWFTLEQVQKIETYQNVMETVEKVFSYMKYRMLQQ